MSEVGDAVRKLASRAPKYRDGKFASVTADVGLVPSEIPDSDAFAGLKLFYHHYGFNRAGGAQAGYNDIAVDSLEDVGEINPDELWEAFQEGCNARGIGLNARMNRGVITEAAELAAEHGNPFAWVGQEIERTGAKSAYDEIHGITGVGPKIARFFVRDAVWVCSAESSIAEEHRHYLQPVDVWVRRAAVAMWPELDDETDLRVARRVSEECNRYGVSNIEFNQGAWFYGAKEMEGDTERVLDSLP